MRGNSTATNLLLVQFHQALLHQPIHTYVRTFRHGIPCYHGCQDHIHTPIMVARTGSSIYPIHQVGHLSWFIYGPVYQHTNRT